MKIITYKEWLNTTKNEKSENSFYTEENVYRLGQDKTHKKLATILNENDIKDFRINILNGDTNAVKFFESLGFNIKAVCIEEKSKDYYFVR